MDRRQLLRSLRSGLAASLVSFFLPSRLLAARAVAPTALLLPLTGAQAALGRSMARAAASAQGDNGRKLLSFDTGGTPAGAAAAAKAALKGGAGLILGPVFADEVRPVLVAVGGRVPVIAFSNDAGLIESGAFLIGITAEQAVAPLIAYARGRGVRRLAVLAGASPWDRQTIEAATRAAARNGMTLTQIAGMQQALGADAPDAVLLTDGTARDGASVKLLKTGGVQPLLAFAGLDPGPAGLVALEGLWLSAPDPTRFGEFATDYEARNGSPPGAIAGLAHDAAGIAMLLGQGGGTDRSAILALASYPGVCGDIRFRADGSAARRMAILAVEDGGYRVVDQGAPV